MRRFAAVALVLALFSVAPAAQDGGQARVDATRLARLDRLLQRYVDENQIGGAVALVLQNGRTVYEKAVGWRDKESSARMTRP